jgi:hypothetical protein
VEITARNDPAEGGSEIQRFRDDETSNCVIGTCDEKPMILEGTKAADYLD